jgi:RNA polymerase sigma factor (sigma-70 family)
LATRIGRSSILTALLRSPHWLTARCTHAVATAAIDAEVLLASRSDLRLLDQLIEALPAPLREMIILRELHELGYREIAEVTGVPIGTVMSRLHRARSLLLRAHSQTGGTAAASAAQLTTHARAGIRPASIRAFS